MTDRGADDEVGVWSSSRQATEPDGDPGRVGGDLDEFEPIEETDDVESPGQSVDAASPPDIEPESWRRAGTAVAAILALGLLGAMWTLSSPIGSSPDDDFHLASIWCSWTAPDDACADLGWSYAAGQTFVDIPAEVGPMWCFAGFGKNSAGCLDEWVEEGSIVRSLANDGAYPGLYYNVMGLTVTDQPVNSALGARLLSWTLCILLLAAGWLVLPSRHRLAYLLVLLVVAIPHGVFLWASTNPSGVVTAAVSAAWCAAIALLSARDRRQLVAPGALLVAATIAAAGSRSDGGLYLFIAVAAACALVWRPNRETVKRTIGVVAVAAAGLLASVVVLTRRLEATGVGGLTSPQAETPPPGSLWFNILEVPYFIAGNLGLVGIGWLDTPMPRIVWVSTLIVFFALVFRGIAETDLAKGVAMAGLLVGLLVVPYYFLWRAGTIVGFEIQPRYVLPLLPVFGFTALYWRRGQSLAGLTALQLSTILTLLTIAHSAALHRNIRRYVTGINVTSPNLDADREWWWDIPISPNAVWIAGSAAFAALAFMLGRALHSTTSPAPEREPVVDASYA